ncbi:MAG: bifunctional DNA primase/polymerase [Symplocastrum torsivum CPER-KK1]|jgi:hypothetical protein|uniref:Bifunctional DNA primase/polymerase n=1 Tax=Symplocastrum torsivum CPER-KK1 TaxID=450513 RepID=A0A951PSW8_9CYAN|nr:bifunctional DNA primase/polymerase [Symplocastrum torsivum CPER-KK1]
MITTPNSAVQQTIEQLLFLGCPPIPVAPKQDPKQDWCHRVSKTKDGGNSCIVGKDFNPIPKFTGKNPSNLDRKGKPWICKHGKFQDRLPAPYELKRFFCNPNTGIGTLGGHGGIVWLDFDAKNYDSQEACDSDVESLISRYSLQDSWIERTGSGGWRIAVKPQQKPNFTNFATTPNGKHIGEAISDGRFTVLAPTIHPNGTPYRRIGWGNPIEVESLEAIGIYPSKDEVEQTERKQHREKRKASDPTYGTPSSPQDNCWDIRNFVHYLESYAEMKDGWASARCPNHNGNSHTSFRVNLATGQFKPWCGCSTKQVYHSALAVAQNYGYELPKVEKKTQESKPKAQKKASEPTAEEDAIFQQLIALRERVDGQDNIFTVKICEQWLEGKLESLVKPGAINIVVAYKGCGKTKGVKPVISKAKAGYAVFHLVALGKSASNNLNLVWHEDQNSYDIKIGVTAKSLWKLTPERLNRDDSFFFIDEIDAVLEQIMSKLGNTDGLRPTTLSILEEDLTSTSYGGGTVILASADVTDKEIDYIRAITPDNIPINIIHNTYKPQLPTIKEFKGDKPDLVVAEIIRELESIKWDEQGNPTRGIIVNDDLKGGVFGAKTIADYVRVKHPEWQNYIWEITSDTSGTPEVTEYLKNINEASKKTLLLSCSPSVTAGFSIENGHFKTTYGLSNGIHTAKDFSQSLVRNRGCKDIRIWAAEQGFTYAANRSPDPKAIRGWYFNNYQANVRHLRSYDTQYNPLTNEWNSPHFELKCQQEAYRNGCMRHLRRRVEQHLENEGYTLEEYNADQLKPQAELAVANLTTINFGNQLKEATAIAAKRLMTEEEYRATREEKDPDILREREKYRLNRTYGEELASVVELVLRIPNTDEKEELSGYEALYFLDKRGWGSKLRMLYLLIHAEGKDIAAKLDLAPEKKQLKQLYNHFIEGQRFAGDIKWNSRKRKAFEFLKVTDYLRPGEFITPDQRKKLVSKVRNHAASLKECLNWTITNEKKDGILYRELFEDHLGLNVLSKQVKGQKGRSQAIDPQSWKYFELYAKHQDEVYATDEDMQEVEPFNWATPQPIHPPKHPPIHPDSGNVPPCNSFNANVGGYVTSCDAQTPHGAPVLAVSPLEVCEKSSEQNLTPTELAKEAFKGVNSVGDFQKLIAQYPREVLVDAADLQDSQPERARARHWLEATQLESAGVNSLEVALTASEIAETKGFDRLILCTSQQHKRLGWTHQQARELLIARYGKRSKHLLTDEEMLDLYDYLKTLPTPDPSSSG